ncbi:MAG: glycosylase [Nevskia sp.]|nr:glycosylase [Nevskia sp.]
MHPDLPQPLPDILAKNLSVIFCGINPGSTAATAGHHFVSGSNRFWRTLHLAGFTPHRILPENDREILDYGCGLTTVVDRPTASASEVARHEFRDASAALERKIRRHAPRCIAFLGKGAYSALSDSRTIPWGPQHTTFGGAAVWVLPNPSGLNRAFMLDQLVLAYRQFRLAVEPALE